MLKITLPKADGGLEPYAVTGAPVTAPAGAQEWNRVAYSAAHVVAAPLADNNPWLDEDVDWERTIAYRHYLWDLGLAVAEAMDTAQRGMGLDWTVARDLIRRSVSEARAVGGVVADAPSSNNYKPGGAASLLLKDITLALNAARENALYPYR